MIFGVKAGSFFHENPDGLAKNVVQGRSGSLDMGTCWRGGRILDPDMIMSAGNPDRVYGWLQASDAFLLSVIYYIFGPSCQRGDRCAKYHRLIVCRSSGVQS